MLQNQQDVAVAPVVTCVMSARFLTRPQLSPSGVSAGHTMPHWLGCSARGPDTCMAHVQE
jgi:hypothetical protein